MPVSVAARWCACMFIFITRSDPESPLVPEPLASDCDLLTKQHYKYDIYDTVPHQSADRTLVGFVLYEVNCHH